MSVLEIKRIPQDDCTVGMLNYEDFRCFTLELPYKDNRTDISCIPPGLYRGSKSVSPRHGSCIAINGVLGRTHIKIHVGNYTSQILGCILVGKSVIDINDDGIPDVSNSAMTLEALMAVVPSEFLVRII